MAKVNGVIQRDSVTGDINYLQGANDVQLALASDIPSLSFGTFGSTPNANGGSYSAGVITLQPASASFPGGVTTGNQTFAGNKNYSGNVLSSLSFIVARDGSGTVGSGASLELSNTARDRGWLTQLNASNNLDYWYFNGTTWVIKSTLSNAGALTLSSLTNGLVKSTSGVLSNATAGTDYTTPTGTENLSNKTITASTIAGYLPLTAGSGNPLTGDLVVQSSSASSKTTISKDYSGSQAGMNITNSAGAITFSSNGNTGETLVKALAANATTNTATTYNIANNIFTLLCDATTGNQTIGLPPISSTVGKILTIKKIDNTANTVTIDGDAAETIDGTSTKTLTLRYESTQIQNTGTEWSVIPVTNYVNTNGTQTISGAKSYSNGITVTSTDPDANINLYSNISGGLPGIAVSNASGANVIVISGATGATTIGTSGTLGIGGVANSIVSGTYTPTLTTGSNVSSATNPGAWHYIRVGNQVTVNGGLNFTNSGAGACNITFTLPVSSTLGSPTDIMGIGSGAQTANASAIYINATGGSNLPTVQWTGLIGSGTLYIQCTYTVI